MYWKNDSSMKKDIKYYRKRIAEEEEFRLELAREENTRRTPEEIFRVALETERYSTVDIKWRWAKNRQETDAIIDVLTRIKDEPEDLLYEVTWMSKYKVNKTVKQYSLAEMLERLRWISGDDFGDDLENWFHWHRVIGAYLDKEY